MTGFKYSVSPAKEKALALKLKKLNIKESDITESFIRAGGRGGQKLNKTSSCVQLRHKPTGIRVKCQKERSQSLNRFFARRILAEKIESLIFKEKSSQQKKIEKIRRQKRRRSRRTKEKMLKDKHIQSQKKLDRNKAGLEEEL